MGEPRHLEEEKEDSCNKGKAVQLPGERTRAAAKKHLLEAVLNSQMWIFKQ